MPKDVAQDEALVVTRVPPASPASNAGLRESDLILAVNGRQVNDPVELRELIEMQAPGATVQLDVWRCGQRICLPVVVGCERYENSVSFGLGIPLRPVATLDLWPFDDGIDVLGIVRAKCNGTRHDLNTPERQYLACASPCGPGLAPQQETVQVTVLPIFISTGTRVVSQDVHIARR